MCILFPPGIGRLGTILALGLALWAISGGSQAIADEPPSCDCPEEGGHDSYFAESAWYADADGLAMQRLTRDLSPVAISFASGAVVLSQQDLAQPFQSGGRLLVGHTFGESCHQVEVSYFCLSTFNTYTQVTDPTGNLVSPFTTFGILADPTDKTPGKLTTGSLDFNSLVQIQEVSRLENGEINFKYSLTLPAADPRIVLLMGVRHVGIREEFDYFSAQAPFTANSVSSHAHTNNDLWGPQLGGLVDYGCPDIWLRMEGKAAICNNSANRDLDTSVNGADATHPRLYYSGTAMVADVMATVVWRPTSALTARIGYQAMWVNQVALAARNYAPEAAALTDATANPPVDAGGHVIYHGPFAGLQVSW